MASERALLISFEGIDGCGKSTQVARLIERLRQQGQDPLAVREPGGTPLSERIRALLLDPEGAVDPRAELLLFAAARAQLVSSVIRPALASGRLVICDRFFDSTTAYQGAGRKLADPGWLADFHRFTTQGLSPDRTYVLDVPLAVATSRRGGPEDRMEAAGESFFERVRDGYRAVAIAEPGRVVMLDGTAAPDDIHGRIWADIETLRTGTAPATSG